MRYNWGVWNHDYIEITKSNLLDELQIAINDSSRLDRIMDMSNLFREWINAMAVNVPKIDGKSTNPFVLTAYSATHNITDPLSLAVVLETAKSFSSIETSMGRMLESTVPQLFGYETVDSETSTALSEIDCMRKMGDDVILVALKSGPRTINDTMYGNIGKAVAEHLDDWANEYETRKIVYIIGSCYGTPHMSNKKDGHAMLKARTKLLEAGAVVSQDCLEIEEGKKSPKVHKHFAGFMGSSKTDFEYINFKVGVYQGARLWNLISGEEMFFVDICAALSLVVEHPTQLVGQTDNQSLNDTVMVPNGYDFQGNASFTENHVPWFLLSARHFLDQMP